MIPATPPLAPQTATPELSVIPTLSEMRLASQLGLERIDIRRSEEWEPVQPGDMLPLGDVFLGYVAYRIHRQGLFGWYEDIQPMAGDQVPPHCEMRELMVEMPECGFLMWECGLGVEPPTMVTPWMYRSPYGSTGRFNAREEKQARDGHMQFRVFHPAP